MRIARLAHRAAVVLLGLLLPVALVTAWASAVLTDTDRYVATVGPLAENDVVVGAVSDRVEAAALEAVDVSGRREALQQQLADRGAGRIALLLGAGGLGTLVDSAVEDSVSRVVVRIVEGEEFPVAWNDANRSAHENLVDVLSGEEVTGDDVRRVRVQLGALVQSALLVLADRGLVDEGRASQVETSFGFLDGRDLERLQDWYGLVDTVGWWGPVGWLLLAGLLLAVSGHRRASARLLLLTGLASVVLLAVAVVLARESLTSAAPDPVVATEIWRTLLASLRRTAQVTVTVLAVVLAGLWLSGPSERATALRGRAGALPGRVRDGGRPSLAPVAGVLAAAAVVAVWWL